MHFFTILIVSQFPYGDFLLHLGYRHNGILSQGVQEPYPTDFELPKASLVYKGYQGNSFKGGHYIFLLMGFFKCISSAVRLTLWIIGFSLMNDLFYNTCQIAPIIMIFLSSHLFFCGIMIFRLIFENMDCKSLKKIGRKKINLLDDERRYSNLSEDLII